MYRPPERRAHGLQSLASAILFGPALAEAARGLIDTNFRLQLHVGVAFEVPRAREQQLYISCFVSGYWQSGHFHHHP